MNFSLRDEFKLLSKRELNLIHNGSLRILKNIGIRVSNKRFLNLLEDIGAKVSYTSQIVKFPERLVGEHIEQAKREVKVRGALEGNSSKIEIVGRVGGVTTMMFDAEKREFRRPTKKDLKKAVVIGNALHAVSDNSPLFTPSDVPPHTEDIWLVAISLTRNVKGVGGCYIWSKSSLKPILEMYCVISKGVENFRKNPLFEYTCEFSSPLRFPNDALEIGLACYELGIPVRVGGSMVVAGGTGPVTLAGTLTLANTETLAGIVITHALGNKFRGYNGNAIVMDMRNARGTYANPKTILLNAAVADLSRYYGFPVFGGHLGDTDASSPGIQAAAERVFSTLVNVVVTEASSKIGMRIGVLGPGGSVGCLPQMVIDAGICEMLNSFFKGVKVNKETIALNLIEKVGIGGSFLEEEHTLKHMREELWFPELFGRDVFKEEGILGRAEERVREILNKDSPHPLSSEQEKEILRIANKRER